MRTSNEIDWAICVRSLPAGRCVGSTVSTLSSLTVTVVPSWPVNASVPSSGTLTGAVAARFSAANDVAAAVSPARSSTVRRSDPPVIR